MKSNHVYSLLMRPPGACPACDGLGTEMVFDEDLVVPDWSLALNNGAIAPWSKGTSPYYAQTLEALARKYKFKVDRALGRPARRGA